MGCVLFLWCLVRGKKNVGHVSFCFSCFLTSVCSDQTVFLKVSKHVVDPLFLFRPKKFTKAGQEEKEIPIAYTWLGNTSYFNTELHNPYSVELVMENVSLKLVPLVVTQVQARTRISKPKKKTKKKTTLQNLSFPVAVSYYDRASAAPGKIPAVPEDRNNTKRKKKKRKSTNKLKKSINQKKNEKQQQTATAKRDKKT